VSANKRLPRADVIEMSLVLECRQLHGKDVRVREICRRAGLSRSTVRGYLRGTVTPGVYTMFTPRTQPARDAIRSQVVEILEAERRSEAPKKQRLTVDSSGGAMIARFRVGSRHGS